MSLHIEQIEQLPEATDQHVALGGEVEILDATAKALLIEALAGVDTTRRIWLPKSVCAKVRVKGFHPTLAVKRWFLSRNRLWWMAN